MAYTVVVDNDLKVELTKHLTTEKNLDTRELLAAYIRISQELTKIKKDLNTLSDKIPQL